MLTVSKKEAPDGLKVYSDLKGHMTNNAVIPSDILVTTGYGSKPDIVILSRQSRTIALRELTYSLERNLSKVNWFKNDKYASMQGDLEEKGGKVHLLPFEVSSRDQILKHTQHNIMETLKHLHIKVPAYPMFIKNLSKISLQCSFLIFHAYQAQEWVDPALL